MKEDIQTNEITVSEATRQITTHFGFNDTQNRKIYNALLSFSKKNTEKKDGQYRLYFKYKYIYEMPEIKKLVDEIIDNTKIKTNVNESQALEKIELANAVLNSNLDKDVSLELLKQLLQGK